MAKDKLTSEERAEVEHCRRYAAQDLKGTTAIFGETYKKLVAIIDRLTR